MRRALQLGLNVVDTAINYRNQRSERTVGAALRESGHPRDAIVLCSKGGYIAFDGERPHDARAYVEETLLRPGILQPGEIVAGCHSMARRFLADQIERSRRNLGVECIDIYYLHNPETQLQSVSREEFDKRLRAAFEQLERERTAGRIQFYGVATWNGFRVQEGARGQHSLERMFELAREAGGGDHGFRFLQLPFNLAMPEALVSENQTYEGAHVSLLEAAKALGVTVVASASILQGKVASDLPEQIREPLGSLATDAQTAIQFVRSTPGITTALVGMSRSAHVEENLQLARLPPASADDYSRLFRQSDE